MIKNKAGTPGLRSQIQILLAGVILSLTASILVVVWLMGSYLYEERVKDSLRKADAALAEYFHIQDAAVLSSARVLASDFGFKAAVASKDEPTIISMLENHSARIGVDGLLLSELNGKHIATSNHVLTSLPAEVLGQLASSATERQFVQVKDSVYRIYKVEVKTPRPAALLMAGLEYDREALNRLSILTGVDVTLYASGAPPRVVSSNVTLENAAKKEILTSDEPFWSILSFAPTAREFGVTSANNNVRFYYHFNADEIQSKVKAAALIIGLISAVTALMAMVFGGVLSARLLDPKS